MVAQVGQVDLTGAEVTGGHKIAMGSQKPDLASTDLAPGGLQGNPNTGFDELMICSGKTCNLLLNDTLDHVSVDED